MLLNFLKLHDADDNSIIIVNQTLITLIHISVINNKKNTIIYINNEDINNITVNESPERVYNMIIENSEDPSKNTDILRLHDADNNSVILVNRNLITLLQAQESEDGKKYTMIFINNTDINNITVNETPDKIYQMLIQK